MSFGADLRRHASVPGPPGGRDELGPAGAKRHFKSQFSFLDRSGICFCACSPRPQHARTLTHARTLVLGLPNPLRPQCEQQHPVQPPLTRCGWGDRHGLRSGPGHEGADTSFPVPHCLLLDCVFPTPRSPASLRPRRPGRTRGKAEFWKRPLPTRGSWVTAGRAAPSALRPPSLG